MRRTLLLAIVLSAPSLVYAQACTDILPALVLAPTQMAAELPDKAIVASYEVAVYPEGTPTTGVPFKRASIASADWTAAGPGCYTTAIPSTLLSALTGHYRGAIRPLGLPEWSDLSNVFAYVPDQAPAPAPAPVATTSPDCTTAATITDAASHVWTLVNRETRRDNVWVGTGQGQTYLWANQTVHVLGVSGFWYRWAKNTRGTEEWQQIGPTKPACTAPAPAPGPVVQVLKHFRIVVDGATYDGDLPRVP